MKMSIQEQMKHDFELTDDNILELENLVRRILISENQGAVELAEVETSLAETVVYEQKAVNIAVPDFDLPLRQARENFERSYLEYHLKRTEGSVGKVAKIAGMERTHLYRKLRALGIDAKQTQANKD